MCWLHSVHTEALESQFPKTTLVSRRIMLIHIFFCCFNTKKVAMSMLSMKNGVDCICAAEIAEDDNEGDSQKKQRDRRESNIRALLSGRYEDLHSMFLVFCRLKNSLTCEVHPVFLCLSLLTDLRSCAECSLQVQRKALLPKILSVNDAEATLRSAFKSPFPNAPARSDVSTQAFLARVPPDICVTFI